MNRMVEERMAEARRVAEQSQDPSTKVGCVLVTSRGPYYGHNTFATLILPQDATREERYEDVVHAEEHVLLQAGQAAQGSTLFSTHEPCNHCYRLLIHSGVRIVVHEPTSEDRRERWGCEKGRRAALWAGVEIVEHGS